MCESAQITLLIPRPVAVMAAIRLQHCRSLPPHRPRGPGGAGRALRCTKALSTSAAETRASVGGSGLRQKDRRCWLWLEALPQLVAAGPPWAENLRHPHPS